MKNYTYVRPEHLNQFGHIYGGNLLKWADEYAWIAASLEYPDSKFVTVGLDEVYFRANVKEGAILEFDLQQVKEGTTSVQYHVDVYSNLRKGDKILIFETKITFVNLDESDKKTPLPGKNT